MNNKIRADIRKAVARGAALLDARIHDWWQQIDLDILQMKFGPNCILGQLNDGNYSLGARRLKLPSPRYGDSGYQGMIVDLGFHARNHSEWDVLTEEWRKIITNKRGY